MGWNVGGRAAARAVFGAAVVVLASACAFALENGSFESSDAMEGWRAVVITDGRVPVIRAEGEAKDGKQCLLVQAEEPADIAIVQKITLPAGTLWRATCWVRTEDLQPVQGAGTAGTLEIRALDNSLVSGAWPQVGTSAWREATAPFKVPDGGEVNLVLFFVGFGKGTGKAWFDGVRVEPIEATKGNLIPVTGRAIRGWEGLDEVMLKYRDRIGCSAATLAISKQGTLLYNRGYGWSDREWMIPTAPDTMMGIASCDKPVADAAIKRIARNWQLGLRTRLFNVLPVKAEGPIRDKRVYDITIEHLVTHTPGWGGNPAPLDWATEEALKEGYKHPIPTDVLLGFVMPGRLRNAPGKKAEYGNFGHDVLRLIVERESGKTFAEYVQDELLGYPPMKGVHDPGLPVGKGEPPASWNYSWDAGGVAMSAPAMCRFMERYWLNGEPRGGGVYTWTQYGSLPNTTAVMQWRPDGINIAAVFNGRGPCEEVNAALQQALEKAMAAR